MQASKLIASRKPARPAIHEQSGLETRRLQIDTHHVRGGCLCSAVRYQALPNPGTAYYCHCRDCQIGSASAFTVAIFCDAPNFNVLEGSLTSYSKVVDSGRKLDRLFCAQCGTAVAWTGEGFPGTVLISLSSLDDPEAHQPVHEGWTESAVSWCRIGADVQSFSGRPVRDT